MMEIGTKLGSIPAICAKRAFRPADAPSVAGVIEQFGHSGHLISGQREGFKNRCRRQLPPNNQPFQRAQLIALYCGVSVLWE